MSQRANGPASKARSGTSRLSFRQACLTETVDPPGEVLWSRHEMQINEVGNARCRNELSQASYSFVRLRGSPRERRTGGNYAVCKNIMRTVPYCCFRPSQRFDIVAGNEMGACGTRLHIEKLNILWAQGMARAKRSIATSGSPSRTFTQPLKSHA